MTFISYFAVWTARSSGYLNIDVPWNFYHRLDAIPKSSWFETICTRLENRRLPTLRFTRHVFSWIFKTADCLPRNKYVLSPNCWKLTFSSLNIIEPFFDRNCKKIIRVKIINQNISNSSNFVKLENFKNRLKYASEKYDCSSLWKSEKATCNKNV